VNLRKDHYWFQKTNTNSAPALLVYTMDFKNHRGHFCSLWRERLGRCKTNKSQALYNWNLTNTSRVVKKRESLLSSDKTTRLWIQNPPYNSERWITWSVEAMKTIAKCEKRGQPLLVCPYSNHKSNAHCAPSSDWHQNRWTLVVLDITHALPMAFSLWLWFLPRAM